MSAALAALFSAVLMTATAYLDDNCSYDMIGSYGNRVVSLASIILPPNETEFDVTLPDISESNHVGTKMKACGAKVQAQVLLFDLRHAQVSLRGSLDGGTLDISGFFQQEGYRE